MIPKLISYLITLTIVTIALNAQGFDINPDIDCTCHEQPARGDTIIVDQEGSGDYTSIQDAINNSKNGDTVHVYSGNYTELLTIDKSISLIGIGDPLVYHVEEDTTNIMITADNVKIENFTVINKNDGKVILSNNIYVDSSKVIIQNCELLGDIGIYCSNNNNITIIGNTYYNSHYLIRLISAEDIEINKNTFNPISLKIGGKIFISGHEEDKLSRNILIFRNIFQGFSGYLITHGEGRVENVSILNNIVSNCYRVFNIGSANISNNIFYRCQEVNGGNYNNTYIENVNISIGKSNGANFHGNVFENNTGIIRVHGTDFNIFNNVFKHNKMGLYIEREERECKVYDNIFYKNEVGVRMVNAPNAVLWGNRFIENDVQASASGTSYRWYGNYPTGGNYWSDYTGTRDVKKGPQQNEHGSDGFGDTPYVSGNVRDIYPIFIDEIPPTARPGVDVTINQGEVYLFNATTSEDDQMVTHYNWTFEYDGEMIYREISKFNFRFDIAGIYDCILNISDFAGNWDTDTITITVEDHEGPVIVTQGNLTIDQGDEAQFSAIGSEDLSGIMNYTWTFEHYGNEIKLYGEETSFVFNDVGYIEVLLEVTDIYDNIASEIFYVFVNDMEAPIADAGEDLEINNGEIASFDGTGSIDNGDLIEYRWTFHYNGFKEIVTGEIASFRFNTPGYYTVTLTVEDTGGNTHSDTMELTVVDTINPEAMIIGRTKLTEGETLSLDGTSSTDNGLIMRYVWTFNDITDIEIEGSTLSHEFESQGYINVTLTVYDQWNNSGSKTVTVEVPDNMNPVAVAGDDIVVKIGTTVTLDGSQSTDNDEISGYSWTFNYDGEEQVLEGAIVEFTFNEPGQYEISLVVKDPFLNRGSDTIKVTVLDNGTLEGKVLDSNGEPIEGASIIVTGPDGNEYTGTSGPDGSFSIPVPEGPVSWKIEKDGYGTKKGTSSISIMEDTVLDSSDTKLNKENGGGPVILIIIILLLILATIIGVVVFFVIRSKKGPSDSEEDIPGENEQVPGEGPSMNPEENKDLFNY